MTYYKISKADNSRRELTYEDALDYVLSCYKDNDMSRDMLSIPNRINIGYSYIETEDNGMVLMAGMYNMLPDGIAYDDEGNRI